MQAPSKIDHLPSTGIKQVQHPKVCEVLPEERDLHTLESKLTLKQVQEYTLIASPILTHMSREHA